MIGLTTVVVGDTIACEGSFGVGVELFQVVRLTATTAVCKRASFKLDSGLMVGTGGSNGWNRRHGRIATAADIKKSRIQRAQKQIDRIKVDESNLEAVESLLISIAPKESPP